jgi:hypothetical protein
MSAYAIDSGYRNIDICNLSESIADLLVQMFGKDGFLGRRLAFDSDESLELLPRAWQDVYSVRVKLRILKPRWMMVLSVNLTQTCKGILFFAFTEIFTLSLRSFF